MNRLIYYPNFDVLDHNWLKFALLYIDELQPIIPSSVVDTDVWDSYNLSEETDLINPLDIDNRDGLRATVEAIRIIEEIERRPETFLSIFKDDDYMNRLKNREYQDYTIYREKFSGDWQRFIEPLNLGHRTDEGIKVSKELGYIYMAILANVLGDRLHISPITDQRNMDDFSVLIRRTEPQDTEAVLIAKRIIEISLPRELEAVTISQIIKFRNKTDFKKKITAFHDHLNYSLSEDKNDPTGTFFKNTDGLLSDITKQIASIGVGVALFSLGVWSLVATNPQTALGTLLTRHKHARDVVDKLHKLARQRIWEMLEGVVRHHQQSLSTVVETNQNAR